MIAEDRILTLAEVAAQLQFSEQQLRRLVRKHGVPVLHTGNAIRFDTIAHAALIEALRQPCKQNANLPHPRSSMDNTSPCAGAATARSSRSRAASREETPYERMQRLAATSNAPKRSSSPARPSGTGRKSTVSVLRAKTSPPS